MKPGIVLLLLFASHWVALGQTADPPIDWPKAKELHQREQRGEPLSAEEQQYLDRAKAARKGSDHRGDAGPASQRKAPDSLKPLTDMSAGDRYEGEDGGLYGNGNNQPPDALQQAATETISHVQALDAAGEPSASGRIAFVSISMSNATQEFSRFKQIADADPRKFTKLTIVDCAQGGQAMAQWAVPDGRPWQEAMNRIGRAGVTPRQVQVVWIKLANVRPTGPMAGHLAKLEADTIAVLHLAKSRFPNLRVAYLGSRIWAGNATGNLNPEPYAYESAFAVRHLIQRQLRADAALAPDKSPLLLWGPYLWAEGEKGRQFDDLRYVKDDFRADGVHPSESGRDKVARQLLEFFAGNPLAKGWFTGT